MAYINRPKKRTAEREREDRNRRERQKVYQSNTWKQLTKAKRMRDPLCEVCKMEGRITPASDTHHLKSFTTNANNSTQINLSLAYDSQNLLSVCDKCHWEIHHGKLKGCKSKAEIIQYLKAQDSYNPLEQSL